MMMPLASTGGISGAIPGYPVQTPGVNFTNVLRAAFVPKAFCHKITYPNCNLKKALQRALV
jgi:hypothetical protein